MTAAPVILVIEDELNTRTLMQVTLAQGGYHTPFTRQPASPESRPPSTATRAAPRCSIWACRSTTSK